jgi:isocitrate dehydrogenase
MRKSDPRAWPTADIPFARTAYNQGLIDMRSYKIAAIPADGIGPEVIEAGLDVLKALAQRDGELTFDVTTFDWGSDYYSSTAR